MEGRESTSLTAEALTRHIEMPLWRVQIHDIISVFATAAEWSARLRSEAEAPAALKALVDRAELHQDGIRLSIRLPIRTSGRPAASAAAHVSLTRQIPLRVRRRGIEMRLVIGGVSGSSPRIDSPILKATARAHRWFHDLVSGRSASMGEDSARLPSAARFSGGAGNRT